MFNSKNTFRNYLKGSDEGDTSNIITTPPRRILLDGISEHWELSEQIVVPTGGKVTFKVMNKINGAYPYIYSAMSQAHGIYTDSSNFRPRSSGFASTIDVNGLGLNVGTADGAEHSVAVIYAQEGYIGKIGTRYDLTRHLKGSIRNLKVYDAALNLLHNIPLTNVSEDKEQKDLVGSVTATLITNGEPSFEDYI